MVQLEVVHLEGPVSSQRAVANPLHSDGNQYSSPTDCVPGVILNQLPHLHVSRPGCEIRLQSPAVRAGLLSLLRLFPPLPSGLLRPRNES